MILVNSGEGARGERLHGGQEDGDEADCHIGQGEENQHHQHHAVGRQQAEKRTSHDLSNRGHMISKHWSHDLKYMLHDPPNIGHMVSKS